MQSVPITIKIVGSNPVHGEVYLTQHYVMKFVSDLWQVGGFLRFPPPIKLTATIYNWNIVVSGVKHHNPNPYRKEKKVLHNEDYWFQENWNHGYHFPCLCQDCELFG
jgi:hypothetical protein